MPADRQLSMAQERMWLLEQLEFGGPALHITMSVQLFGPIVHTALEQALRAVADRHEPLRTSFHDADGVPFATVHDQAAIRWESARAGSLDEALRWGQSFADQPFDLGNAETLRAGIVRLDAEHHLLVLVLHHIVADGWSIGALYADLAAAYAALRAGGDWQPGPLPMTYSDQVSYELAQSSGDQWRKDLTYWRATLDALPAELGVHTSKTRPAHPTRRSYAASCSLTGEVLGALRAFAQKSHVSPTMILAAAWAATLYRHGGGPDLAIGMPVSGRDRPETQPIIGLFMNVLPIRVRVDGEESFAELVSQVRNAILGALEHRQVPLTRLVAELQPERSLTQTPFFQTVLNHGTAASLELDGVETRPAPIDSGYIDTDLALTAVDSPDQSMRIEIKCSVDLFDEPTAGRMLSRFRQLLTDAVANPGRPVDRLELVDGAERDLLGAFAARPPTPLPAVSAVVDLIESTVRRRPEAVAVRAGTTTLTYAELNAVADRMAGWFSLEGAAPGTVVALHLGRSWEMLAAMLAVWKTGAAYLPVDPTYPRQRTNYMLTDADACLVVTDPVEHPDELPTVDLPVLHVADLVAAPPPGDVVVDRRGSGPDDPAYLIYTSGSTGAPKGVEVPHRAVVNFLTSMSRMPGCAADDTVLALTSPSFDIAVLELFLPLVVGARVVIAAAPEAIDPLRLAAVIRTEGVTVAQATPVTWQQLLAVRDDLRLRLALCGGEQLSRPLANRLATIADEAWNMYGPTETTVWSLMQRLSPGDDGVVPIGRPIENTTAWVLDEHLQPCPIGVPGELCIGGAGLALGYHGLPTMTRERFVNGPLGELLYRTGDVVRITGDGEFVMLGRADNQIKLNGHRIELDEINALLRRHPLVEDAITVVRRDGSDNPRLVSYVIPARR